MAPLKIVITSKEIIKPSSPTPPHLNTVKLSFIDQIAPRFYVPLLFFYQYVSSDRDRCLLLKKSLSDVLVCFYPLAGRIQGDTSIHCNDEGVDYYEANVDNELSEVIHNPNLSNLNVLLPFEPIAHNQNNALLGVQVNHFRCGGMAICVCISHKMADGAALVDFIRAWAAMCGGLEEGDDDHGIASPKFDGALHFPPIDLGGINMPPEGKICKKKIATERFIFDEKMLNTLKKQAVNDNVSDGQAQVINPTRVEVVSAFIWKSVMEESNSSDVSRISGALHAVNLRPRMVPSIPQDSFGNFWWFTIMDPLSLNGGKYEYPELVTSLREAIRKVDKQHIKALQNGVECLAELHKQDNTPIQELCRFSSWCGFPVYEVDFGWGKPLWVCPTTVPFQNAIILMTTRCGQGIEAWVNMLQQDMPTLEHDFQLLTSFTR